MENSRFVLAGTGSGVGKTTIAMGLLKALSNRGLKVQAFKSGPDYIDTAFHTHVTGNASRNLDGWMLSEEMNKYLLKENISDCDIAVIEGAMGLYDGAADGSNTGSTAHISKITKTPVILIVNGGGASTSVAATVLGFQEFDKELNVAGVIVNKVHGDKHYKLVKAAIETHTNVKCIGYMSVNNNINLDSRHLGLIPSVEVHALDEKIETIATMLDETIDFDSLLEIAASAGEVQTTLDMVTNLKVDQLRIGIADDKAFNFYYADNLDLLEQMGVELVSFSPISDEVLPENLHGLYIGGGFPEVFASQIADNLSMKISIKNFIENLGPVYAECGGLMYLCNSLEDLEGNKFDTVGVVDYDSVMTKRLQRFGYVAVETNTDTIIGPKGIQFRAHEFHRSKLIEKEENNHVYEISKKRFDEVFKHSCGYQYKNFLGGYPHIHFYTNIHVAENFVKSCDQFKRSK